jgi:hypothetical protein
LGSDETLDALIGLGKWFILSNLESPEPGTPGSPLRHHKKILADTDKKDRIKNYLEISLEKPYHFLPRQLIFGHTHVPFVEGLLPIQNQGRTVNIDVYNTGGWVVDNEEPIEIIQSHPLPLLVKTNGDIESLDFPWPQKETDIAEEPTTNGVISYISRSN